MAQASGYTRLFTLQEANDLLPILKPWLDQMLVARQEILEIRPDLEPVLEKGTLNGGHEYTPHVLEAFDRMRQAIDAIQNQGVLVKDINSGLLDFPTRREGKIVFLCWQVGEPAIQFWHDLDVGFRGRQPL